MKPWERFSYILGISIGIIVLISMVIVTLKDYFINYSWWKNWIFSLAIIILTIEALIIFGKICH